MEHFDVIVIGGGHAGVEAAHSAALLGVKVGLITMPGVAIASAPCNPAIGGVGKGQVVREIDALGGLMGKIADKAGIQFRTLNESKGYAVQSTRVQIDKDLYSEMMEAEIKSIPNLEIIYEKVSSIKSDKVFIISDRYTCQKLILTTGTFLGGKLHTGAEQKDGGRVGKERSPDLKHLFPNLRTCQKRFKTGTPPRINKNQVNTNILIEQKSDPNTLHFHWKNEEQQRQTPQVSCYIAHTNDKTMSIIRENKEKSPIFNGQITGVGPRYCPSIEDKAFRYPDKHIHHVFVEPEGLNCQTMYPNGLSTSLPIEVQQQFINSIEGLEHAEILVPGYSVEYDVLDTTQLNKTLELIDYPGLYFAGQVNGTSGYEEAAGQGLMAGINAALSVLKRNPLILSRNNSYLGVMIEDLVLNTRDEPYRLFTARNENRLLVREDNVIQRIYPYRQQLGLNAELDEYSKKFIKMCGLLEEICEETHYLPTKTNKERFESENYGSLGHNGIKLIELLRNPKLDPVVVLAKECGYHGGIFPKNIVRTVAISLKYKGYIQKSQTHQQKVEKLYQRPINWQKLCLSENISFECKERIRKIRPESFGELKQIEGIRPATLTVVASQL